MSSSTPPPARTRTQRRRASTPPKTTAGTAGQSQQTPSSHGFWHTVIPTSGLATTTVPAAHSRSPSTTPFASVNTYQALDTAATDNESTDFLSAPDLHEESPDLLSTPEISEDLTPPPVLHAPKFIVDVAIGDAAPQPVAPEASVATLGNVLTCALQRLDDKWTTILTTYNNAQDAQRC